MSIARIVAIVVVYLVACGGWMVLGTTTMLRSEGFIERLGGRVAELWGPELVQRAPTVEAVDEGGVADVLARSEVRVALDLEHRRKGLVWYPVYDSRFEGLYVLRNDGAGPRSVRLRFALPEGSAAFRGLTARLDGETLPLEAERARGVDRTVDLAPGQERRLAVGYHTRGMGSWRYDPTGGAGRVRDLVLAATTDFAAVDFPDGSIAPDELAVADGAATATWRTGDMVTDQPIAIAMPVKLNPGPLVSRITFFAPVCLGFFFLLIAAIDVVRRVGIHPMHYLFVAGGFAAFHVLLAYLVDHLAVHLSFAIAAATSVGLTTWYLRMALGPRFPWPVAAGGQVLFLVLFSYSFFLEGATGLTVAIGSVATLAVLMKLTAHLDWDDVFGRRREEAAA